MQVVLLCKLFVVWKETVTEAQNSWDWKGLLEVFQSNTPVQEGIPRESYLGLCSGGFWRSSRREDSTNSLSNLYQCSLIFREKIDLVEENWGVSYTISSRMKRKKIFQEMYCTSLQTSEIKFQSQSKDAGGGTDNNSISSCP